MINVKFRWKMPYEVYLKRVLPEFHTWRFCFAQKFISWSKSYIFQNVANLATCSFHDSFFSIGDGEGEESLVSKVCGSIALEVLRV